MLNRAYATIEIKAIDEDARVLTGIATTAATDRVGDIVEPKGAEFKLPIPFLWQHKHSEPIGHVTKAKVTAAGIEVSVQIARIDEPGKLKERVDEAWQSIKSGLVRGLSIGFQPVESARIEGSYGMRFIKWMWLELSAVTIPANAEASIQSIKAIDSELRAASGMAQRGVVRLDNPPGASGSKPKTKPKPQEGSMNVQDQIKAFEAQRAEKATRMSAIMAKSAEAGETLDAEQESEYDGLKSEVATIDKHLERLREHEKSVAARATPVINPGKTGEGSEDPSKAAAAARTGNVIQIERKLPPGVGFARLAGAIAASKGSYSDAERLVKSRFPDDTRLHSIVANMHAIKAAQDVGTTRDSDYASPLVAFRDLQDEFIEFLRPQTIIGRINARRVPFNISVPRQTSGGAAAWVGEGAPKPVTQFAFNNVTLGHTKLAAIAVISQELARFSNPSAELVIRDSLAGAIIQQMDLDFVNPANSGTSNVKPASITDGVSAIPSSGSTEANVREDIHSLFAPFIAANLSPQNGVWLMSATNALALSLMVNALGQPSFPGITMSGGTFWGMPVIVSESVGNIVILANASDILLADDGQVTIDASDQASVQMESEPTNPVVAATVLISLWQQNLLGIRAERFINWTKARTASVQYLSGVAWGEQT